MTRVVVEAAFGTTLAQAVSTGGTWTDLTGRVDMAAGISITGGAQDELSDTQVGTCTLTLDNLDGALTPENASSPYSPNVVDGVPLRVSIATVISNFVRNPSFEGGSVETWEWSAGVDVLAPAGVVKAGSNAARVTWSPSAGDYFQTAVYGLTIGARYTASAYVRVPAGDVAVKLRAQGVDSAASAVNDVYTRLTVSFTATGAVTTLRVMPTAAPAAGDLVFVDAVMVEEATSASALNYVSNGSFEIGTSGWALGSDASTSFASSSTRAWQGSRSMLVTWGGALNSNPTFETALAPWTGNGAAVARVNTVAQSGSWSMQITPNGVASSPRAESETFAVTGGQSYKAEGWLRCVTSRTVSLNVNWYDSSGVYITTSFNSQAVTANTWTQFSGTFSAPANAAFGQLAPTVPSTPPASDILYVDEVRLLRSTGSSSPAVQTVVTSLVAAQQYTASAYVWVPAGARPVSLAVSGISGGAVSSVTGSWQRITYTFTATATSHTLQIAPSGTPQFGTQVWVDAVQVEEGAAATAWTALDGAELSGRFWGLVNQWPVRILGLNSKVTITASDVLSVLSRADDQMRAMLIQEVLVWGPNAYYPLDEDSTATSGGDASGTTGPQSLTIQQTGAGGTLTFGSGTAPLGMAGAPLFTPASASAGKYLRADLGASANGSSFSENMLIEAWFSTSTAGRNILTVHSADKSIYLILYLAAGTGFLTVESKTPDVAAVTTTMGAVNLADGRLHHLVYEESTKSLYVDGVFSSGGAGILDMQDLSTLTVGASQNGSTLWSGSISSVAVYFDSSIAATDLALHYTCGTTGFSGETADERALRLVSYVGLGFSDIGTFSTGIAEQAALGRSGLEHLREVERTESGKIYASRSSPTVILQGRSVRYNPTSALSIVYADYEPDDFTLAYDTQKVANVLTLTRPGGATQRMVQAVSRAARGPMGRGVDTLCTTDLVVTDLGNWLLQRYAQPQLELRGIRIEAYTMGLGTYRALMAVDISSVMTVTSMPSQAPASSMSATVEGWREDISEAQHFFQFLTSKTFTDTVWVLDDAAYSVLGSTTRLAY
ncbi:carbohydrate binding domain-containing protein [Streptomyces griseorubiginosus]|uniref:carbohydrate binding domain-containing protein n=1 Tax=Streptomyces griseorubiginosus TaxID=67304 RepID=UPI003626C94F